MASQPRPRGPERVARQPLPASVIALTHPAVLSANADAELSEIDIATAILTAAIFELLCARRLELEFRQRRVLWVFRRNVLTAVGPGTPESRPTIEEGLLQACALRARDGRAPVYDVVRSWFGHDRACPEQHVIEAARKSAAAEGW